MALCLVKRRDNLLHNTCISRSQFRGVGALSTEIHIPVLIKVIGAAVPQSV